MPKISVVMPAYNCAPYLREAMDSILNQTIRDFEFIIIDDASTDDTAAILASYTDPRISIIRNPQNLGVAGTLNVGLETATGTYIARMDADDIALPERFARQISYLEQHPDIGCLSGNILRIDSQGAFLFNQRPAFAGGASSSVCRWELLWASPLIHPTVMLRRQVIQEHHLQYSLEMNTAEDHDLWCRMQRVTALARLPDVLLHYRITGSNVSVIHRQRQLEIHARITQRELEFFWNKPLPEAPIKTIVQAIAHSEIEQAHIPAATRLLMQTWQRYKRLTPLTPDEQQSIRRWVTNQLLRLARSARGKTVLIPLLALRRTAPRELFSRNGLKLLIGAFQK